MRHQISNPDAIYVVGDIHGHVQEILETLRTYEIYNSLIVQVGDFGLGFQDYVSDKLDLEMLEHLNMQLQKQNNFLIVIRGNHDNPKFWKNGQESQYSNLWLIADYEVVSINDRNWLFVGGAISIDRNIRRKGQSWWEDEVFVLNLEKIQNLPPIDVVITHTAPSIAEPPKMMLLPGPHLTTNFRDVVNEANDERDLLTDMLMKLDPKPTHWYYGHFHRHLITNSSVKFIGLAECEFLKHLA